MAVISISAIGIGPEFISGIPQFVELDTNVPATIFYTLDGSSPNTYSTVYLGPIEMPTTGLVHLKVLAISGSDSGTLDIVFQTHQEDLSRFRRIDGYGAGIVVDAYDVQDIVVDGYTADAYGDIIVPARASDIPLQDLDIRYSTTGVNGEGPGTLLMMGVPPIEQLERAEEISMDASSPNNQNVFFNPKSLYIVIDGTDGYESQVVKIINRPLDGTLDPVKYLQATVLRNQTTYVSGGLVRTFYNNKTGKMVSYYFDHCEMRWIKSIQSYDTNAVPQNIGLRKSLQQPLVFKWIYNKRSAI
jgi:hypothetical protein